MGAVKERDTAHLSGLRFVIRPLRPDGRLAYSGSSTPDVGRIKTRGDL